MKALWPILFLIHAALAGGGLRPDGSLDMPALQAAYKDGELLQVKTILETFLKNRGSKITRDERIFSYKYLGVISAADPAGRMRAESYFNQLFDLSPHIELTGMFVSKTIQDVFDEVKKEYQRNKEYGSRYDALGNPIATPPGQDTASAPPKDKTTVTGGSSPGQTSGSNRKLYWWTAGFAAVAAAGTVLWLSMDEEEKPGQNHGGTWNP